jgi:RNA polymerase sigma-70 factor (ECF subfamily)
MSDTGRTDRCVLEAIRSGDGRAWSQLVDEYQGRLLKFATTRVSQRADAEDIVQDTFTSFIKVVNHLQIEVSLETYLFGILRNEIVNRFRTRWARTVCLIQDACRAGTDDMPHKALAQIPAPGPSVSWYVSRDEQHQLQERALTETLQHMINRFQDKGKFRDLKIAELVFYCQMPNQTVANLLNVDERVVRVVKHRCLKRIREDVLRRYPAADISLPFSEDLLTEAWEQHRLSCPKRSTLNAFLLETLSPEWFDYVDFHLTTLGCHFCRASFKDLQEQQTDEQHTHLRQRIMNSTVGFLSAG